MRHLITIKVPILQNEINNRTEFNLFVSGFKAVESFPLPEFVVKIKHAVKTGTPSLLYRVGKGFKSTIKIGATLKELSTTLSGFIKSVVYFKHEANLRMSAHFVNLGGHITKVSVEAVETFRERLRIGTAATSGKILQIASNLRVALFVQLKHWDFKNPDGDREDTSNRYLLSDIDNKKLSEMDIKG